MSRYQTKEWKELVALQNEYFSHIDILTITGFMNDEELQAHIERYRERAKRES